ncbi:hypothetical protein [Gemmiger formicilis]|uniref:hypothetical protein n=1 Tax=Gemmiger formicilis TaxID=745368 RepID=UPI0039918C7F
MEAETDTGRQPGHLRKNGNKKRQISVRENWRAKNSHYYTELHGTIFALAARRGLSGGRAFFDDSANIV